MNMTERLEILPISTLVPYENNARTHSPEQIAQLRRSLREFGFVSPVLIDADRNVIAGHGRLLAAQAEGITEAPCVYVEHLTDAQRRAYILADNRLAEAAGWDQALVSSELLALRAAGTDLTLTGFGESDILLTSTAEVREDAFDPTLPADPVSRPGQLWQLGRHRLLCGDATSAQDVQRSMGGGTCRSPAHRPSLWRGLYGLRQESQRRHRRRQGRRPRRAAGRISVRRGCVAAGWGCVLYLVPLGA